MANAEANQSFFPKMTKALSNEDLSKSGPDDFKKQFFEMKRKLRESEERTAQLTQQIHRMGLKDPEPNRKDEIRNTTSFAEDTTKLSDEQRKSIRYLMDEISKFDGTTDVESFISDLKHIINQVNGHNKITDSLMIDKLLRGCKAKKFKGEAHRVVSRLNDFCLMEIMNALRIAFGRTGKSLSQLQEERNQMCQMRNEKVEPFIKRYADLDRQIQRAIDLEPAEFREYERRKERLTNIKMLINFLRLEIKTEVSNSRPEFLNEAYQRALEEEKVVFDKKRERSRLAEQLPRRKLQQTSFKRPSSYE